MFAVRLDTVSYLHISLPSEARSPTAALPVNPMIVRTPPTSAATQEEYPAGSLNSLLVQMGFPVILSSATMLAPSPPGVTIKRLPSTRGDSLISHVILLPPKSFKMFRRHTAEPSLIRKQARSPFSLSA